MPETAGTLDGIVDQHALVVIGSVEKLRRDLPGSVHDARVAIRKLRSTLVVFAPMLDGPPTKRLNNDLRWFGRELSHARDAQVVRARIVVAMSENEASATAHLGVTDESRAELLAAFDRLSAPEWRRAEDALDNPRVARLVARLEKASHHGLARRNDVDDSPVERVSTELRDLIDNALATCSEPSNDERIHALRKQVKRVRFAVAALPAGRRQGLPAVANVLEDLQDRLGAYQDAVVTAGVLEQLGRSLTSGGAWSAAGLADDIAQRERLAAAAAIAALPEDVARLRQAVGAVAR